MILRQRAVSPLITRRLVRIYSQGGGIYGKDTLDSRAGIRFGGNYNFPLFPDNLVIINNPTQ